MTAGARSFRPRGPFVLSALLATIFLFVAVFRFLGLKNGFPNDHFLHLAGAQQMLVGDWPTRDFQDPGLPLMYAMSALAELLLGRTLFAEAVLVAVAFGAAAVLTGLAVHELTRSTTLAVIAALLEVAIFPRTYGYPKILLYATGVLLFQRYVSHPGTRQLVAMAVVSAVAFLFRHDHGLFLAIGGLLTVLLTPVGNERRAGVRRALTLALIMALLIAPYLMYVQLYGGASLYLRTGMEFSAREAGRQGHVWPTLAQAMGNRESMLVYVFHALPLLALLRVVYRRHEPDVRVLAARLVPLASVAFFVNLSFIRDPLNTRLPDAIVPAALLVAWLAHDMWTARARQPLGVAVAIALLAGVGYTVAVVGRIGEELDRAGLLVSWTRAPGYARELAETLRTPLAPTQIPSSAAGHLLPFLAYVERCTTRSHRLLVTGFLPEVPVLVKRPFAGGQSTFIPGYFSSEENQRLVLSRLRGEIVPFVVVPKDYASELDVSFPMLMAYVRARYEPLATFGDDSETGARVLVDGSLRWQSRDETTGWPCHVQDGRP